ncbi:MAG: carbohydrate kinase [Dethiosulfatibacter sp.]|nr:carbohydrate kinase [Dethiosulfatibacter sp.]
MSSVICIGEMLVDFIGSEKDKNLAGQDSFIMKPGGAPANVACVIGALGGSSYFYGSVGKDGFGDFLEKTLKEYSVQTQWLERSNMPTTLAFVSVDSDGERDFIFYRGADAYVSMTDIEDFKDANIRLIHFGAATGFLEGNLRITYNKLLNRAKKEGYFISFDPNYRDAFWSEKSDVFRDYCNEFLQLADLVKLSEEEAFLISETNSEKEMISYFRGNYKGTFAVTLGSRGALVFNDDWEMTIPAPKVSVVDTTGAGDAFVGALLFELSKKEKPQNSVRSQTDMKQYVESANKVASDICTELGALSALKIKIDGE